jgi:hypothetical protein
LQSGLWQQPSINDIVTESTIGTWTGEKDGKPVVYHSDDADADENKMMGHLQRTDIFYSAIRRLVSLLTFQVFNGRTCTGDLNSDYLLI